MAEISIHIPNQNNTCIIVNVSMKSSQYALISQHIVLQIQYVRMCLIDCVIAHTLQIYIHHKYMPSCLYMIIILKCEILAKEKK